MGDLRDEWSALKTGEALAMMNAARKRSTILIIIVVIAILSGAILIQYAGRSSPPAQSSTATSSSTATFAQSNATSSSSSGSQVSGPLGISFGFGGIKADQRFVTPNVTMNYTVTISRIDTTPAYVALSAVSTVAGVTATFSPDNLTFSTREEFVVLRVSADPSVSSPTVPVELTATTPEGSTTSSTSFSLEKGLVVVESLTNGLAKPATLHVSAGQTVKWFDIIEIDDDGNGYTNVKLADGSAASPTMVQFDVWSYRFDAPGTYTYQVASLGYGSSLGTIIVSA